MNDAEYAAAVERIKRAFYRWRRVLGFGWWTCTVEYARGGLESRTIEASERKRTCLARCICDWQYMNVTIEANVPALADQSDDELERTMIHEFLHAAVHEMREWRNESALDHEERVVSHLTGAIKRAIEYGRDPSDDERSVEDLMRIDKATDEAAE